MCDNVVVDVRDVGVALSIGTRTALKSHALNWLRGLGQGNFWALRHVTFAVRAGEVLGVIGRNGAGKSTLLQVLTGTMFPNEGEAEIRGRPTPLLSLDFGSNKELSGRSNLRLMGLYLGLPPDRIEELLPRCIEFCELGAFIDEPLKHYSSGMVGRLGMSLALCLEPDILLVDEILGVGDEAFRGKCEEAMRSLMERSRAIVIVTHNLKFVESFCTRAMWLHQGEVQLMGDPGEAVRAYLDHLKTSPEEPVR